MVSQVLANYDDDPDIEDRGRKVVEYWQKQLTYEETKHKDFRERDAKKAEKVYWDESEKDTVYPILSTVVGIKHSALYSEQPDPVVRRRFHDSPNYKQELSLLAERALQYACDKTPVEMTAHRIVDDWLLTGLGQWRIRYEAEISEAPNPDLMAVPREVVPALVSQGVPETIEVKTSERIWLEAVPWKRFHWQPCVTWEDCEWVGYEEFMSASEIQDRFGVDAKVQGGGVRASIPSKEDKNEYRVMEYHYKPGRKIYVIAEGFDEPLEVREDALNLKGMFPSPEPLMANVRSDRLVPTPDYHFYKHGAATLNRLQTRANKLTEQLKDAGFHDAALKELDKLQNAVDGMSVPVKNLAERASLAGGSLDGLVWTKPIENKAKVLLAINGQMKEEENKIFRITGVTDIVQGMAAEQDETYGATRIKSNWAEIRLTKQFDCLKKFMVDTYQMMAEVMLEHFDYERLIQITGVQIAEEEIQILKDDEGRCYAIDIEHELSVARDQEKSAEAKGAALDRLISIGQNAAQLIPAGVWTPDFTLAAMTFAISDFPEARSLSDAMKGLPDGQQQMQMMQQQIAELTQQLGESQQGNMALQVELQKRTQASTEKDLASAEKSRADAMKSTVEAAQTANETLVEPVALVDEMTAYRGVQ